MSDRNSLIAAHDLCLIMSGTFGFEGYGAQRFQQVTSYC